MNNTLDILASLFYSENEICSSRRIAKALKGAIDRGQILPGTRLPSSREVADRLGVSRATAHRNFETLTSQGYIKSVMGKASEVQKPFQQSCMPGVTSNDDPIDFSPSMPEGKTVAGFTGFDAGDNVALGPIDAQTLSRLQTVIRKNCRILRRSTSAKEEELLGNCLFRQAMCDYLLRTRLVRSTRYDIAVVSGASTRLELLMALLLNPGDDVVVPENLSERLIRRLNLHGAKTRAVGCDAAGMRVDLLRDQENVPKLVYITPSRGALLTMERRNQLANWVRATGSLIIEDDCDSDQSSGTECLPAVQSLNTGGRVIYLPAPPGRLSPLVKVSCAVLPPPLMPSFLRLKQCADPCASRFEQKILTDFLVSGHFESMMEKVRLRGVLPAKSTVDSPSGREVSGGFDSCREKNFAVANADCFFDVPVEVG